MSELMCSQSKCRRKDEHIAELKAELAALRELINQHNLDCSCPCENDSSDTAYFDYHGYSGDCPAHGKIELQEKGE